MYSIPVIGTLSVSLFLIVIAPAHISAQLHRKSDVKKRLKGSSGYRDMMAEARSKLISSENKMDSIYGQILIYYSDDTSFIANLKASQKKWIDFVKSTIETMFPGGRDSNGSIYPLCLSSYEVPLWEFRTKQLRRWLQGTIEGDVCPGSLKTKQDLHDIANKIKRRHKH